MLSKLLLALVATSASVMATPMDLPPQVDQQMNQFCSKVCSQPKTNGQKNCMTDTRNDFFRKAFDYCNKIDKVTGQERRLCIETSLAAAIKRETSKKDYPNDDFWFSVSMAGYEKVIKEKDTPERLSLREPMAKGVECEKPSGKSLKCQAGFCRGDKCSGVSLAQACKDVGGCSTCSVDKTAFSAWHRGSDTIICSLRK